MTTTENAETKSFRVEHVRKLWGVEAADKLTKLIDDGASPKVLDEFVLECSKARNRFEMEGLANSKANFNSGRNFVQEK